MSDDELRIHLEDELRWEPRLDDAAIDVAVTGGAVTLSGTVRSFRELGEATNAAKRVYGVKQVDNELHVALRPEDRRTDRALRKDIRQAMALDALIPVSVDASVRHAVVTLKGSASYQFEREEAAFVAGNVTGVIFIDNAIELGITSAGSDDVESWIRQALRRDARLDADRLSVKSSDGSVTLSGTVGSWPGHDAAVNAAWAAPGVAFVNDRIVIVY